MKYPREHIDTLTPKAAQSVLIQLGLDHLPREGSVRVLKEESTGQYIMVLAKDGNYDILYEHFKI